MLYRSLIRPILFLQDPETAHERVLALLSKLHGIRIAHRRPYSHPGLEISFAGLTMPNPVGLAAGCDKNGVAIGLWPGFGFGSVEIGTVTAQPQPGNPRPRIFRAPERQALVNRLGFNSDGAVVVARRLSEYRLRVGANAAVLGVNVGKTRDVTEDGKVLEDYIASFRLLAPLADYVVVNVSSPNTPGLREWQEKERLTALLAALTREARLLKQASTTPIVLKVSPDLTDEQTDDLVEVALETRIAGIIATNTTIQRDSGTGNISQAGGLSGRPLRELAQGQMVNLFRRVRGALPLIGVGGISSAADAYARIRAGASAIQIYTGMIYEGPFLSRRINIGLLALLERDGFTSIAEAVGIDT